MSSKLKGIVSNKGNYRPSRNTMRRYVAAIIAASMMLQVSASNATWLDDWVSSTAATAPQSMEGQVRGFASGGSFNAHWASHNDYLLSTTPPKLSIGCGGIDFNMGSISWLQPQQLVKKLQNILTNSAFLAFDMALETLCPTCSTLMKAAQDLSQKLNDSAINDCNAAKGITADLRPAMEGVAGAMYDQGGWEAVKDGFSSSYDDLKSELPSSMPSSTDISAWWKNMKTGDPASKTIPSTSGCTGIYAALFPSDTDSYPVDVMNVVGDQLGVPADYNDIMSGMVGDIVISKDYTFDYIPHCQEYNHLDISQLANATTLWAMQEDGTCSPQAMMSNGGSFTSYISTQLSQIMDTLAAGNSSLSPDQQAFITHMPTAVLYALRLAVGSGQQTVMLNSLSELTAQMWLAKSFQDLTLRISAINRVISRSAGGLTNQSDTCNLKPAKQAEFQANEKLMLDRIAAINVELDKGMAASMNNFMAMMDMGQKLKAMGEQLKQQTAQAFGPSIAARATRYF